MTVKLTVTCDNALFMPSLTQLISSQVVLFNRVDLMCGA